MKLGVVQALLTAIEIIHLVETLIVVASSSQSEESKFPNVGEI